ncbi:MAG: hypothetical protein NC115_11755 [Bacteroidales bacterium]|nr:hypothetical protein [Bacteroidales bacterium]
MKKLSLILLLALLLPAFALAQKDTLNGTIIPMGDAFLVPLQDRDSVLIADQLMYGISLEGVESGTQFRFPEYGQDMGGGVMVLTPWQIDTVKVRRQKKGRPELLDIKAGIVIASFDEGEYELPVIAVGRLSNSMVVDTLVFNPQRLSVRTMPVDTATFEVHDIKGQIRYPVTFREVLPYLLLAVLLCGLIALAVYLFDRYRRKADGKLHQGDPAHIIALRKLDKYRGDKLWAAEKQKGFYSGVTDALREYIVARYGISAMEMTTKEIFDGLKGTDIPEELYAELKSLFERADYVKFAKYVANSDENASTVPFAVRFVTATYQADIESSSNPDKVMDKDGDIRPEIDKDKTKED